VVDLARLLADQVACWAPAAAAAGTSISLRSPSCGVYVAGDPTRLAQATGNLIANAIEHGRGAVEVRLRHQADAVRIEVADEGPGLPDLPRQLAERARGGRARRGRGLAIAAEIAERHGGRLGTIPTAAGAAVTIELSALETAVDARALP
jgi:signal transduction histidine kinase